MSIIEELVAFSNRYGADGELVLAGGGNTSAKSGNYMYVKGSGTALATIDESGFVKMNRAELAEIFTKKYPENDSEREAQALADLMAARAENENKRPSVETTLHALFEQTYVLHLHPAIVNAITCSVQGEAAARRVIKHDFIWVDACKPGYVLAKICSDKMNAFKAETGKAADIIILQNHGIFIAADTVEGLDRKLNSVICSIKEAVFRLPDTTDHEVSLNLKKLGKDLSAFGAVRYIVSADAVSFCADAQSAQPLMKPFTPDHIVYCKAYPLFAAKGCSVADEVSKYKSKFGFLPRVILCEEGGIICLGSDDRQADTVKRLFEDAIKIAVYSESFGGALHMTDELTDFIVNWEVEAYRSSQNK